MPTNANGYNSRLTDEALEKRFRDTFRSQGGAELVDDLYASGVIVPVVDFTQAAEGSQLPSNLQTAWDFSTGSYQNTTSAYTTIVNTAGFWQIDLSYTGFELGPSRSTAIMRLNDGSSQKNVWAYTSMAVTGVGDEYATVLENKFVVYLRPGDRLEAKCQSNVASLDVWYRQIATSNGDLVNPSGFTSS